MWERRLKLRRRELGKRLGEQAVNRAVEWSARLWLRGERFIQDVDPLGHLKTLYKAFAKQEQALFFATGWPTVGMSLGQIARSDQVSRATPLGHDVVAGVE